MRKKNREPELLTDQEPAKKRGLMRVIELIDRDSGKFFKAGLLALPGMALFFAAVQVALANAAPVLLLACIPIGMLTAPAMAGAVDTVLRSKRDEVGWWWWDTYKAVYKRNFVPSLLPGAIGGLVTAAQIYCLYYLSTLTDASGEFLMLLLAVTMSTGLAQFYFPMMVTMELPFFALVRNCFVLLLSHPLLSLAAALVQVVYYGLMITWFPLTLVILVLTSVWLPMLLAYSILYGALDKHLNLTESYAQHVQEQWGGKES